MKHFLLIAGVVMIIACVLSLLFAAVNLFGYYHVLDGSAKLYRELHHRMILFSVIGIALGAAGTACILIRHRI